MAELIIQETDYCPSIKGGNDGVLEIIGKSTMENPLLFYASVHEWLSSVVSNEVTEISVLIDLTFINSSSTKQLLKLLLTADESDMKFEVKWVYPKDNDFLKERGEEFAVMLDCPFHYVEKEV